MPKFPPKGSILRAIAAGRVGWLTACGEWIDNAFDRNATRVAISFERDSLTIEDNGEGTVSPHRIVQLGDHTNAIHGLGEYGMGGKESLLWAGGEKSSVSIVSTHRGTRRRLEMNWTEYARSEWDLPDAIESVAEPGEIGTKIIVRTLQARPPKDITALCEEIGYLYSHAIRHDNRQITIKGSGIKERPRIVAPWQPPAFDNSLPRVRDVVIHVGDKEAIVHAGVVKEGVRNKHYGLTYWFKYRVILAASAKGCGDYAIQRVCGFVELRDGWKSSLARNKNGLTVDDDALFAEVEQAIRPVLEAAETAGSTLALRDLSGRLESKLGAMLNASKDTKAKRDRGESHGAVKPKHTTRTHKRAEQEQAGRSYAGNHRRGLQVGYAHLDGTRLGDAKPPNITLNLDNEFIADKVRTNDESALVVAIVSLVADYDSNHADDKGNRYLRGMEPQSFSEQCGKILASAPVLDGKSALKAVS